MCLFHLSACKSCMAPASVSMHPSTSSNVETIPHAFQQACVWAQFILFPVYATIHLYSWPSSYLSTRIRLCVARALFSTCPFLLLASVDCLSTSIRSSIAPTYNPYPKSSCPSPTHMPYIIQPPKLVHCPPRTSFVIIASITPIFALLGSLQLTNSLHRATIPISIPPTTWSSMRRTTSSFRPLKTRKMRSLSSTQISSTTMRSMRA